MMMYGLKKPKFVKGVQLQIHPPEEKPQIGKIAQFKVDVTSNEDYHLSYVVFELVNERTDKRAPLDRVTSRSRYLYRYNIDKMIKNEPSDEDNVFEFPIRIPVHKEPSRNDKFICIRWQLIARTYMKKDSESTEFLSVEEEPTEIEVV